MGWVSRPPAKGPTCLIGVGTANCSVGGHPDLGGGVPRAARSFGGFFGALTRDTLILGRRSPRDFAGFSGTIFPPLLAWGDHPA